MSEKGIDASLIVHMFDTMENWNRAVLVSGDADFVPVVRSLRRRGKSIIGAGFNNASAALTTECFVYKDLLKGFFIPDYLAYCLFKKKGIIQEFLNSPLLYTDKLMEIGWEFFVDFAVRPSGGMTFNFRTNSGFPWEIIEKRIEPFMNGAMYKIYQNSDEAYKIGVEYLSIDSVERAGNKYIESNRNTVNSYFGVESGYVRKKYHFTDKFEEQEIYEID